MHAIVPHGGGHWDFQFCDFGYFLDRFFGFFTKKLRIFDFADYCGLQFQFYSALGFRFSTKIKSGFRFAIRCGLVFFQILFGKYAPQRSQPRARLLWFRF